MGSCENNHLIVKISSHQKRPLGTTCKHRVLLPHSCDGDDDIGVNDCDKVNKVFFLKKNDDDNYDGDWDDEAGNEYNDAVTMCILGIISKLNNGGVMICACLSPA